MAINLKNRSFLKLLDFTPAEIQYLLDLAAELKAAKKAGTEKKTLTGKNIALIFEKTSTRTRCSFEVAAYDQGAHVTYLGPTGSQIGIKESMKDTARVLGRMFDGIEYRGFAQTTVEQLAEYSGVPVWNGLTNEFHPTQILADFLTMREHSSKPLSQVSYAYLGDARYNMGNSLLVGGAKMGMDVRIVAPKALQPAPELVAECRKVAAETGARITITDDVDGNHAERAEPNRSALDEVAHPFDQTNGIVGERNVRKQEHCERKARRHSNSATSHICYLSTDPTLS